MQFYPQARPEKVPLPHDEPDAEIELDSADVDFVQQFGPSLGFLQSLNTKQLDKQVQRGPTKSKAKPAAPTSGSDNDSDSPEAVYERVPRQRLQDQSNHEDTNLPTKNLHGELVYAKTKLGKQAVPSVNVRIPLNPCWAPAQNASTPC